MINLVVATDEDLATQADGDWPLIAPSAQLLGSGSDGVISGWAFSSASNNFTTQGVLPACLVIVGDGDTYTTYAVDSLSGASVVLRRPSIGSGLGMPLPASTGLTFSIPTAMPHIAKATYEIQRRFNIQSESDIQDVNELRWAVVYKSLVNLYRNASRNIGEKSDDFGSKAKDFKVQLDDSMRFLDSLYGLNRLGSTTASAPLDRSRERPLVTPLPEYDSFPFF